MNTQIIYYDLETLSLDPDKAKVIEACFIFPDGGIMCESLCPHNNEYVRGCYEWVLSALEEYNEIKKDPKQALAFHNIDCIRFLVNCYMPNLSFEDFLDKVKEKLSKREYVLMGWNNKRYDDIILSRYLKHKMPYTIDLMPFFEYLREDGKLEHLRLSDVYEHVFKKPLLEAHTAKADAEAVKKLHEYILQHNIRLIEK